MKDLTKLTPDEANKIECLLLTLTTDIEKAIDAFERLSANDDFPEETRRVWRSNAEWYRECYHLIYGKEYTK